MGRDKATVALAGGRRLVDLVADELAAALRAHGEDPPRVVVSGAVAGHECVPDAVPGLGPLGGLRAVLDHVAALPVEQRPRSLLVVPVDLPALTAEPLLALLRAADASDCPRAVAFDETELPALLPVIDALAAEVRRRCDGGDRERSVWRLLGALGAARIPLSPEHRRALANANTPQELEEALRGGGGEP